MKLRLGFVSNSSSSSYALPPCHICGRDIDGAMNDFSRIVDSEFFLCGSICRERYAIRLAKAKMKEKESKQVDLALEQAERFKLMDFDE